MVAGTDIPELPLLAPGVYIMSRDVPKSESIARGLRGLQDTRITNRIYAYMRVASSQVRRTLHQDPGRSIMLHFPRMINIAQPDWEGKLCAPKARAQLRRRQKIPRTSSAPSRCTVVHVLPSLLLSFARSAWFLEGATPCIARNAPMRAEQERRSEDGSSSCVEPRCGGCFERPSRASMWSSDEPPSAHYIKILSNPHLGRGCIPCEEERTAKWESWA